MLRSPCVRNILAILLTRVTGNAGAADRQGFATGYLGQPMKGEPVLYRQLEFTPGLAVGFCCFFCSKLTISYK